MMRERIAQNIILARKRLGLSLQKLADTLGVAKNSVHDWEKMKTVISPDHVEKLASLLNVDPSWFFAPHSPESVHSPETVNFEPDSTLHNQKIKIDNQTIQKDATSDGFNTAAPGVTMIHGDRSSKINITEELTQQMTEKMENCNQQIKEMAGQISELAIAVKLMAEIIEKNQKNNEAQNALLLEILKNAQENERLAEVNYLLEVGEISATEARLRMRNPDNYK